VIDDRQDSRLTNQLAEDLDPPQSKKATEMSPRLFLTTPKFGRVLLYRGRQQEKRRSPSVLASCSRGFSSSSSSSSSTPPTTTADKEPSASSTTSTTIGTSTAAAATYVTGTVKNYMRKKAFGFVIADGATTDEDPIFIHRSGIKSLRLLPSNSNPANPFLLRNERVRFQIVLDDSTNKKSAQDLEYEDGTPIPIYRSAYVDNVKKYHWSVLGEAVYKIMDEKDETVRRAKIKTLYEKTKRDIAEGQTRYDAMTGLLKRGG
jgi:cold shock CspA family protein